MQAAGEAVVLVGELGAGVQPGQDDLHAGDAFLGVLVDRHPAAVVDNRERSVVVQRHRDLAAVAGDRLVRRVVDHLLGHMIRPLGRGVHAGPLADRLETGEDFDCRGVVVGRAQCSVLSRGYYQAPSTEHQLRREPDLRFHARMLCRDHCRRVLHEGHFAVGVRGVGIEDARRRADDDRLQLGRRE